MIQLIRQRGLFLNKAREFTGEFIGTFLLVFFILLLTIELAETAECQKGILTVRPEDIVLYGRPPESGQTNSSKGRIAAFAPEYPYEDLY